MKPLYEWVIPLIGFLIWVVLIFTAVPVVARYLKKKAVQHHHSFEEILISVLVTPLILFLLALGVDIFIDTIPHIPSKLMKYANALLIVLYVLGSYLFLDRSMTEALKRYRNRVEIIASAERVMRILFRTVILSYISLIVLDRLKITITPFIASLGIGTAVVGLALQDTLSNIFSWGYILMNKPFQVGDYVSL